MKYTIYSTITILTALLIVSFTGFNKLTGKKLLVKAENLTVIKVDGKIRIVKTGETLSTGFLFLNSEKLSFETPESRAAVISSKGGRFVLVPNAKSGKASNLLPAMSNVATRSGALLNTLSIITYFGEDFLVLDSLRVKIPSDEFIMDDENFFYMKYEYENDTIAKKIPSDGKELILSAKSIYSIDGELIDIPEKKQVKLYYTKATTKKGVYLTTFNLCTPNKDQLIAELKVLDNMLGKKTEAKRFEEIEAYLFEFYGRLEVENVKNWLSSNYNN